MLSYPKTLQRARKQIYGCWAGNPKGSAYREGSCAYEVQETGRGMNFYQCQRKNGHGIAGLYCKQHARMIDKEQA